MKHHTHSRLNKLGVLIVVSIFVFIATFFIGKGIVGFSPKNVQLTSQKSIFPKGTADQVMVPVTEAKTDTITNIPEEGVIVTDSITSTISPENSNEESQNIRLKESSSAEERTDNSYERENILSPPITSDEEKYTIQIAALQNKEKILELFEKFKSAGYNSYIIETTEGKEKFYRLRLGSYKSREEGEKIVDELIRNGIIDKCWVTRKK